MYLADIYHGTQHTQTTVPALNACAAQEETIPEESLQNHGFTHLLSASPNISGYEILSKVVNLTGFCSLLLHATITLYL